jgi:ATP synthase protein I
MADEGREATPEPLGEAVERKARRKAKARAEQSLGVWFGLGMFGLVGWAVAVPALLGIALGLWLDRTLADPVSWTLTFLFVGIVLGCLNAWWWVRRESGHD